MLMEEGVLLKDYTTFRIGGKAQLFCRVGTLEELTSALRTAKEGNLPVFILGDGSNVLMPDEGYPGLVIKIELKGISFGSGDAGSVLVSAAAGESWDVLVSECVRRGLYGIENLSAIPGTVGATPIQNIGAYGVEVKDVIEWVEVLSRTDFSQKRLLNNECEFGYRDSLFKGKKGEDFIVTRVCYRLKKNGALTLSYRDVAEFFKNRVVPPVLSEVRGAIIAIRSRKFPDLEEVGTAGSFFKNPIVSESEAVRLRAQFPEMPQYPVGNGMVKVSLGWILDKVLKIKGLRRGGASVFENQSLVLVNNGSSSAREVTSLAREITAQVEEKLDIKIEPEVRIIST